MINPKIIFQELASELIGNVTSDIINHHLNDTMIQGWTFRDLKELSVLAVIWFATAGFMLSLIELFLTKDFCKRSEKWETLKSIVNMKIFLITNVAFCLTGMIIERIWLYVKPICLACKNKCIKEEELTDIWSPVKPTYRWNKDRLILNWVSPVNCDVQSIKGYVVEWSNNETNEWIRLYEVQKPEAILHKFDLDVGHRFRIRAIVPGLPSEPSDVIVYKSDGNSSEQSKDGFDSFFFGLVVFGFVIRRIEI